mgnify:FL=1
MRTAVVVGAQGVIGRHMVDHLIARGGWDVVGLSRRPPAADAGARHIAVDLLDAADADRKLAVLAEVTHVFYCAFQPRPTWAEHGAPNLAMLRNSVGAIARASRHLEHVTLIQGTKIYGSHLGPFRTPARESDPPHMPPNFYIDQQQWLSSAAEGQPWGWTALRPHTICGFALGSPMNLMLCLAVYAAISKELGLPLRFPGRPGAWTSVYQLTGSGLLAEGMEWAATMPAARGQAFNLTNGDYFRWCNVWPRIADAYEMAWAPPQTIRLTELMADKAQLWQRMVAQYGLVPHRYEDLASWPFADYVWACDWDIMSDTGKIRRAGFLTVADSEQMIIDMLRDFRARRIVP